MSYGKPLPDKLFILIGDDNNMEIIIMHYYNLIIKPLENECAKLERKIYSRRFSDILTRCINKENLIFYENLLCEAYRDILPMLEKYLSVDGAVESPYNEYEPKNESTSIPS